eukprot:5756959-Amphidinium_carterae.3
MTESSLETLVNIAKALPDLVQSLMPGTTDRLVKDFASKVTDLFQALKESSDINFSKLMELMTEAT